MRMKNRPTHYRDTMWTLRHWKYLEQYKQSDTLRTHDYESYKRFLECFKQLDKESQRVLYIRYYKYVKVEIYKNRKILNWKSEDIYRASGITSGAVFKARKNLHAVYESMVVD